jgi:hypothetical protein
MKLKLPNTSLLQCVIVTAATDRGADKRANAFRTFNAAALIAPLAEDLADLAAIASVAAAGLLAVDLADLADLVAAGFAAAVAGSGAVGSN